MWPRTQLKKNKQYRSPTRDFRPRKGLIHFQNKVLCIFLLKSTSLEKFEQNLSSSFLALYVSTQWQQSTYRQFCENAFLGTGGVENSYNTQHQMFLQSQYILYT